MGGTVAVAGRGRGGGSKKKKTKEDVFFVEVEFGTSFDMRGFLCYKSGHWIVSVEPRHADTFLFRVKYRSIELTTPREIGEGGEEEKEERETPMTTWAAMYVKNVHSNAYLSRPIFTSKLKSAGKAEGTEAIVIGEALGEYACWRVLNLAYDDPVEVAVGRG